MSDRLIEVGTEIGRFLSKVAFGFEVTELSTAVVGSGMIHHYAKFTETADETTGGCC